MRRAIRDEESPQGNSSFPHLANSPFFSLPKRSSPRNSWGGFHSTEPRQSRSFSLSPIYSSVSDVVLRRCPETKKARSRYSQPGSCTMNREYFFCEAVFFQAMTCCFEATEKRTSSYSSFTSLLTEIGVKTGGSPLFNSNICFIFAKISTQLHSRFWATKNPVIRMDTGFSAYLLGSISAC